MPRLAYPAELTKAFWDKKKGSLEAAPDLQTLLKGLEKKHDAAPWTQLGPDWAKGAADADRLKALYEGVDKLYRAKVAPLRLEAAQLSLAADKAGKAKDAAKPLKEACTVIAKAATAYAKAVAAGMDELETELAQARKQLPGPTRGEPEDEDDATSALVDPKRLLKQLQLCKADASRRLNFAMVDDGKQDPVLVVHPRLAGRAMLARLVKDLGIGKGAFGQLSLDGSLLMLVVEKKVSGLVKRIRIPIRACGFKLGKVVLVDEAGQTLDQDDEDGGDTAAATATAAHATTTTTTATRQAEPGAGGAGGARPEAAAVMQLWAKVRNDAIATLKSVAKEIADLKDPESAKAVIEISAVVKNLTPEPRTRQQVAELVRYLDQDDVVLDVAEFAHDIRTPMLKVLAQLHKAVSA